MAATVLAGGRRAGWAAWAARPSANAPMMVSRLLKTECWSAGVLVLSALQHSITPSLRVANFPPGSGCLSLCSAHTGLANSVRGNGQKTADDSPSPSDSLGERAGVRGTKMQPIQRSDE